MAWVQFPVAEYSTRLSVAKLNKYDTVATTNQDLGHILKLSGSITTEADSALEGGLRSHTLECRGSVSKSQR